MKGIYAYLFLVSLPSLIFASAVFLILDNFSYNVIHFSATNLNTTVSKAVYCILLSVIFLYFQFKFLSICINYSSISNGYKKVKYVLVSLILSSVFCLATSYQSNISENINVDLSAVRTDLPNILFFNMDGVNSSNMSVYGYNRDTTPFLSSISNESLVFENHFTNSEKTTGSVGSLLTGQHPTFTRLIFRPDTLKGESMYKHLPGILLKMGYYNIDINIRHYVDSYDLRMRNAFNYGNGRNLGGVETGLKKYFLLRWPDATEFIEESYWRLQQRVYHLSGYRLYVNPFSIVINKSEISNYFSDKGRVERLKQKIIESEKPFFANVHLLGSHGPRFDYQFPVFTESKIQYEPWDLGHYDNSILQWDNYIKDIYALLESIGQLENTILVFGSDHGIRWAINKTIPLVVRFPNKMYTGRDLIPSQRLDIAPTILSYLGVSPPKWMVGKDLISRDQVSYPIFIAKTSGRSGGTTKVEGGKGIVLNDIHPPFYTLGSASMVYCGYLYTITLEKSNAPELSHEKVYDNIDYCSERMMTHAQQYIKIVEHLKEQGYETDLLDSSVRLSILSKKYNVLVE
ncbi:sulfatase-like hydrolase/transferase [Vibrio breoganii]